jgi:prolyl-tRNA editing enzyme YbaK/EbsC (Cys-tRNA(Pro) deacylase)
MRPATHPSALRVQSLLGADFSVVEFDESTRTAAEAATAIGCAVAQIAKSIIFKAANSQRAVLVVTSGTNRVDEKKVAALIGEKLERADADFVRAQTGFAIGGVPPLQADRPLVVLLDRDLGQYPEIWAAGGTPNAVFRLRWSDLQRITDGQVADVATTAVR